MTICKDIPAVTNDVNIVIFNGANNTASLSFKQVRLMMMEIQEMLK